MANIKQAIATILLGASLDEALDNLLEADAPLNSLLRRLTANPKDGQTAYKLYHTARRAGKVLVIHAIGAEQEDEIHVVDGTVVGRVPRPKLSDKDFRLIEWRDNTDTVKELLIAKRSPPLFHFSSSYANSWVDLIEDIVKPFRDRWGGVSKLVDSISFSLDRRKASDDDGKL